MNAISLRTCAVAAVLLLVCAGAFSESADSGMANCVEKYSRAIVWVKYVQPYEDWDGRIVNRDELTYGLVVSAAGRIAVRGHIHVKDFKPYNFRVVMPDGAEFPAEYAGKDPVLNIAFCDAQFPKGTEVTAVNFKDAPQPQLGQKFFILSRRPAWQSFALDVLRGFIASVLPGERKAFVLEGPGVSDKSGAPVFDESGRALGVVGFDLDVADGGLPSGHPGMPLLFTGAEIMAAKPTLASNATALENLKPGWLGLLVENMNDKLSLAIGGDGNPGVYVTSVVPGSPAAMAGIRVLDAITEVDGKAFSTDSQRLGTDFIALMRRKGGGTTVSLTLCRAGKKQKMDIILIGEPPDGAKVERVFYEKMGLAVRKATWDYYVYRNIPEELKGVVVDRIVSGSPADLSELEAEDLIVGIIGHQLTGMDDFVAMTNRVAAEGMNPILLEVRRGARRIFIKLEQFTIGAINEP
ncbi:MAG: PDZ domain-containing protein [Candidatus Brocadiia bacterium]